MWDENFNVQTSPFEKSPLVFSDIGFFNCFAVIFFLWTTATLKNESQFLSLHHICLHKTKDFEGCGLRWGWSSGFVFSNQRVQIAQNAISDFCVSHYVCLKPLKTQPDCQIHNLHWRTWENRSGLYSVGWKLGLPTCISILIVSVELHLTLLIIPLKIPKLSQALKHWQKWQNSLLLLVVWTIFYHVVNIYI